MLGASLAHLVGLFQLENNSYDDALVNPTGSRHPELDYNTHCLESGAEKRGAPFLSTALKSFKHCPRCLIHFCLYTFLLSTLGKFQVIPPITTVD